jgi:hypothetical protein
VLDIFLEINHHSLFVKGKDPKFLKEVSYILFFFHLFLGGKLYDVSYGTVVTGILDMRPGKHDLHFLVGVELLPHAFVNIPDKKMHIGVFYLFSLFILYLFFFIHFKFYSHIFIHSLLPMRVRL